MQPSPIHPVLPGDIEARSFAIITEEMGQTNFSPLELPVVKSTCPANGYTKRQEMKELLDYICQRIPNARQYMLHALRDSDQYGLWDRPARGK